jgi:hypothetical protein
MDFCDVLKSEQVPRSQGETLKVTLGGRPGKKFFGKMIGGRRILFPCIADHNFPKVDFTA